jgi:hypothetical protein
MLRNGGIAWTLVIHAITDAALDLPIHLAQQCRHLSGVLRMAFRHCGGDNSTLAIDAEMPFLPTLTLLLTVFLRMPFPLTTHLQARTVDDQVDCSWCHPIELLPDHYRGMASRQRRMIRAGKRHVHQGQKGTEEALGLPQRQANSSRSVSAVSIAMSA